jgi:hypothetical protein
MIHNLTTGSKFIIFTFICEIGKCSCEVDKEDKDTFGRAKMSVSNYEVLGFEYTETSPVMVEGIKRIANQLQDVCDNNGWILWSY